MMINNPEIYQQASAILRRTYGENAAFREGQYEAIEATMTRHRTLVVQKTGWGKSLVYFLSTVINREKGRGVTLVISPLLVLMDNQMEFAGSMGLQCAALNSSLKRNGPERVELLRKLIADEIDMLFITPETLLAEDVQAALPQIKIGLFVIDEAHCISDWGHDFRLDYGHIGRIINGLSSNVPVLATTATANDRVVKDLQKQLGQNVYVSRGPLSRSSLHIQVLPLESKPERYAWLLDNLPRLPGTGIIYCITTRDCEYLAGFLNQNGVSALPYYSGGRSDEANKEAIEAFQYNRIKAIVATTKLGMGYDKGDISFVIHFQSPANIVAWYQQIGRAGRKLKDAYIFLMTGKEDDEINNHFIDSAFPSREESTAVMNAVENARGLSLPELMKQVNLRTRRIENALYFLENERYIRKEGRGRSGLYYSTAIPFHYNEAHYQEIMAIRRSELAQMHELIQTKKCLILFAANALDDPTAVPCGKCFNCTGRDIFPGLTISEKSIEAASDYIRASILQIKPRKKWPDGTKLPWILMPGICLSKYGDYGYGSLVKRGKYPPPGMPKRFDDRLVTRAAEAVRPLIIEKGITHLTCVPSLNSDLVKDFTERLAKLLKLPFVELLEKTSAPPQKKMENSNHQCSNAMDSFHARSVPMPERVLLVDDMVDSRWTLAACGCKIMESGVLEVYPLALADSSHGED